MDPDVERIARDIEKLSLSSQKLTALYKKIKNEMMVKAEVKERKEAAAANPHVPFVPDDKMVECFDCNLNLGKIWDSDSFGNQFQDRFSKIVGAHFLRTMFDELNVSEPDDAALWMDTQLHRGTQTDMSQLVDDFTLLWNGKRFLIDAKCATTLKQSKTHSYQVKKEPNGTIDGYLIILPKGDGNNNRVVDTAGAKTFEDALGCVECVVFISMDPDNDRLCKSQLTVNMEKAYVKDKDPPTKDGVECLFKWTRTGFKCSESGLKAWLAPPPSVQKSP